MASRRLLATVLLLAPVLITPALARADDRPNVLWITCEDMGPHIGPYGDTFATTPHLDRFARTALRYGTCWSNAPVCAPARTTLITGMYAPTLGAEHMRSEIPLPKDIRLFPQYLRDAGYYCTNNAKEDYNVIQPRQVWDESSKQAHWKNRRSGQPFFAVFNIELTHESQIQKRRPLTHDPAKVRVPDYQPDLPAIREDWAQYYDNITLMDAAFGQRLKELDDAGLAEDTIVWFFSDHGPGLPRNKRCAQDSGLCVPLLIRIPERFKSLRPADYAPGGESRRLVSFADFGPTVLSLAGVRPPEHMQAIPFLGSFVGPPREFLFGYRSRMDERIDLVRCIRDERCCYVRNFLPHKPQGQHVAYMFLQAGARAWKEAHGAGRLARNQAAFFEEKPLEVLYDLQSDPDETVNLADDPASQPNLDRLRSALDRHLLDTRDLGLLPESELHRRSHGSTPYELGLDIGRDGFGAILSTADAASRTSPDESTLAELTNPDSAVRYWTAVALLLHPDAARNHEAELRARLQDDSPAVRIAAAEAILKYGSPESVQAATEVLLDLASPRQNGLYVSIEALNALDALHPPTLLLSKPRLDSFADLPENVPAKLRSYCPSLVDSLKSSP